MEMDQERKTSKRLNSKEAGEMHDRKTLVQKMLGAASGIFVAVLFAVPLAFVYYTVLSNGSGGYTSAILILLAVFTIIFGTGIFLGVRDAVRRWREISQLQTILDSLSEEERKEFDAAIVQSDVELCVDESGKTHVLPLDH